MTRKHLSLGIAALLAAGGVWFALSAWRSDDIPLQHSSVGNKARHDPKSSNRDKSSPDQNSRLAADVRAPLGQTNLGRRHRPPVPNRRFMDFTPEQRVEFARKGRGPGG